MKFNNANYEALVLNNLLAMTGREGVKQKIIIDSIAQNKKAIYTRGFKIPI